MAGRSTLIVAGRASDVLPKEKLEKLLFYSLVSAFGDEAPGADAEFSKLTAVFSKPSREDEFGLTFSSQFDNTPHLVRVQYNPTAEQFRAAFRESLAHALNVTRVSESVPSTDGRVVVVYTGQVVAQTGEWLLADSALTGYQILSWLDSNAAQVWWPQLQKFPNIGDKLTLNLYTPLAGSETSWSTAKYGYPQVLMSHVDVRMVQLTLNIDGNWRSNGKLVLSDSSQTVSYEGIRGFVQLTMSQHQSTHTSLDNDAAPLGCALSAPRPALYLFPGGGLGSAASALFSLQGFAMLFGGSFTSQRPPVWWKMVRNLSKLDAVVLPDWSPSSLLTYRFVNDLLRNGTEDGHLFGEVILPPVLTSASNETASDLLLAPPSTITGPHESTWAGNTLASETLPPSTVLYFKLGWGELRLQPLAQRAGLVLLWSSAVHPEQRASSLRILLPATQLAGATPVQGLSRLFKALISVPQLAIHSSSGTQSSPGKASHKVASDSSPRSTSAPKPTAAPPKPRQTVVPSMQSSKAPPPKSSATNARPSAERPSTARPLTAAPGLSKKTPLSSESKPQQRPSTAPATKAAVSTKAPPTKGTPRTPSKPTAPSSKPSGPTKQPAPSTANRLVTHSNLVASKQAGATAQAKPRPKSTPGLSANKPAKSGLVLNGELDLPIPEENTSAAAALVPKPAEGLTSVDLPRHDTKQLEQQLRDSLELAPMDPLMSGWRSVEQSQSVAVVPECDMLESPEQSAPSVDIPVSAPQTPHPVEDYNEVYKVHKAEHLHEADESEVMDDTQLSSVGDEFSGVRPVNQIPSFAESPTTELSQSPLKPTAFDEPETMLSDSQSPVREGGDGMADNAHIPLDDSRPYLNIHPNSIHSSLPQVPKLIDPAVTDSYPDGLHLTESGISSSLFHTPSCARSSNELILPDGLINSEPSGSDCLTAEVNEPVFPTQTDSIAMSCPPFGVGYEEVEGFPHNTYDQSMTEPMLATIPADILPKPTSPDSSEHLFLGQEAASHDEISDHYAHAIPGSIGQLINDSPSYLLQSQADSSDTNLHSEPFYDGTHADDDTKGDHVGIIHSFTEETQHYQFQPEAHFSQDVRDSIPEGTLEAAEIEHESHQPPTEAILDDHYSHVVTNGSDIDVNFLGNDAQPLESTITITSEESELMHESSTYHKPASHERQSSDISDVDANDREMWTTGLNLSDYSNSHMHSAFADNEQPAVPVSDAPASLPSDEAVPEDVEVKEIQEELMGSSPADPQNQPDSSHDSVHWQQHPICVSADSLEELHGRDICDQFDHSIPVDNSVDSTTYGQTSLIDQVPHAADIHPEQLQAADSTTLEEERRDNMQAENPCSDISMGYGHLIVDATGDHPNDGFNLGSPTSEASVDSVVHAGKSGSELPSPGDFHEGIVSSSVHHEDRFESDLIHDFSDGHYASENGFGHEALTNGCSTLINGNHTTANEANYHNGNPVHADEDASLLVSTSPASKSRFTPEISAGIDATSVSTHDEHEELGSELAVDSFSGQQLHQSADEAHGQPTSDFFDPIQAWGQPQGLPAPVVPPTTNQVKQNGPNRPTTANKPKPTSTKPTPASIGKKSAPQAAPPVLPSGPPVYLDVIWVPTYLVRVPHQMAVEFFSRVRSKTYILSGEALHPTIGEALIEGKTLWGPQDVEILCHGRNSTETPASISILPTDEPYEWSCWLRTPCGRADRETGESRLQSSGFHVLPAASLCDIEYSAGDTAFRCEGVRVDL